MTSPLTPSRRTTRAAAMPAAERRRAIVEAVIPLLVEYGAGVTTRQIAEAAGVAEGTIFGVFEDKRALLHAAAHAVMDPEQVRQSFAGLDPTLDLSETVRTVAAKMLGNTRRAMTVLMAIRSALGAQETSPRRTGPPSFILEANHAVLTALTEVFARYADQLRVEPDRAALMVRSLVFGSHHPGMAETNALSPEDIADLVVHGVSTGQVL